MKTISSQEIKRRGISAVDEDLKDGPVHVIKNNKLKYVIMDQEKYSELVSESEASYDKRLIKALDEIERGEIQTHDTINDLMDAIDSESI
jgi:PHD/YefM family antitoxin component YafN of YafNO toxin-antitoxin module